MRKVLFYKKVGQRWRKKVYENTLGCAVFSARTINPCNHITLEWDGAGLEVCLIWYRCLTVLQGQTIPRGWAFSGQRSMRSIDREKEQRVYGPPHDTMSPSSKAHICRGAKR